ncbi:hypothetical protein COEREDRAFT_9611 [Coemansia reversa NRRL 1564]|uniref:glutathione transferase n=1 Tax=Coemansia reversa (strain ATCC 12441 / NRRL 1564) TaxID=763665 RepID=A0A2G5B875_COERN|nr:hypothetical protein COEREDRAFT_9611 [Coemansia reversa NRRL 1564]|eukprot:PIA15228.1 hypothetical protein COEREDRAFT_9611 [Coemansia reversa NRRL 1564]
MSSKPSYVFRYFNLIGRAETCRLLLAAGNANWVEEHPEWPQDKEQQPFGRLPVLIEKSSDGSELVLSESFTIERYLGRIFDLLPTDPKASALQEQMADRQADIIDACAALPKFSLEKDKEMSKAGIEDLFTRVVKSHMEILSANSCKTHLFGDKLSFADITLYAFYKIMGMYMECYWKGISAITKAKVTPEILALLASIEAEPLLESHLSKCESLVTQLSN